ncbi:MAG: EamA family transporter [Oscillospiraceae bacterium]
MKQQTRGSLMLLLCAMVWGAAFVAQSEGMNYVGPFTMQAARYFLAGLVLVPVIFLRDKRESPSARLGSRRGTNSFAA